MVYIIDYIDYFFSHTYSYSYYHYYSSVYFQLIRWFSVTQRRRNSRETSQVFQLLHSLEITQISGLFNIINIRCPILTDSRLRLSIDDSRQRLVVRSQSLLKPCFSYSYLFPANDSYS